MPGFLGTAILWEQMPDEYFGCYQKGRQVITFCEPLEIIQPLSKSSTITPTEVGLRLYQVTIKLPLPSTGEALATEGWGL
jgi:hypothetical protein